MVSTSVEGTPEPELLVEINNHVAFVTLNRPKALNALTLGMIRGLTEHFTRFARDDKVKAVVLRGVGEKAFCAGGDIRFLHESATSGNGAHMTFFTEEYRLNYLLHRYVKPVLCMLDGIVMGGGMGISQGSGYRLVGPKTKMAMPETAIGLIPDVGGSYFLSRSPIGLYLALTGSVIGAADALFARLADRYLATDAHSALQAALLSQTWSSDPVNDVAELIEAHATVAPPSPLQALHPAITRHFVAQRSVLEIIRSLEAETDANTQHWARDTAAILRKRSPTFLEVTRSQQNRGAKMTLAEGLRMELGVMRSAFEHGEPIEGIRALIIDKDHAPHWNPPRLENLAAGASTVFFNAAWPNGHPLADLEARFG